MQGIADYEFIRPLGESNYGTNYLANAPARLGIAGRRGRRQGDRRADLRRRVPARHPGAEALQRRRLRPSGRGLRRRSARRRVLLRDGVPPARVAGEAQRRPRPRPRASPPYATRPWLPTRCTSAASPTATSSPPTSCSPTTADGSPTSACRSCCRPGMMVTGLGQIGLEFTDPAIMLGAQRLARQRHLVARRVPPLRADRARASTATCVAASRCCSCASILASSPRSSADLPEAAAS